MGTKTRAGKAAVATKAASGTVGAGRTTPAGKEVAASSTPALTPKMEVTEEAPAPGPLLPYPPGFDPKVEDGGASHSYLPPLGFPTTPPPGEGPSNASRVIRSLQSCGRFLAGRIKIFDYLF